MAGREAVIRFLDRIARNEELNRKLAAVPRKATAWATVAGGAGFDFTVEDLRSVAQEALGKPVAGEDFVAELLEPPIAGELKTDQLVMVAGGAAGAPLALSSRLIRFTEGMKEVKAYPQMPGA